MIIKNQLNNKAVFTESGSALCVKQTSEGMSDYYGMFFNGKCSGDKETYPYAIVFYNSCGDSHVMGVYENADYAKSEFERIIQAYKNDWRKVCNL